MSKERFVMNLQDGRVAICEIAMILTRQEANNLAQGLLPPPLEEGAKEEPVTSQEEDE